MTVRLRQIFGMMFYLTVIIQKDLLLYVKEERKNYEFKA